MCVRESELLERERERERDRQRERESYTDSRQLIYKKSRYTDGVAVARDLERASTLRAAAGSSKASKLCTCR